MTDLLPFPQQIRAFHAYCASLALSLVVRFTFDLQSVRQSVRQSVLLVPALQPIGRADRLRIRLRDLSVASHLHYCTLNLSAVVTRSVALRVTLPAARGTRRVGSDDRRAFLNSNMYSYSAGMVVHILEQRASVRLRQKETWEKERKKERKKEKHNPVHFLLSIQQAQQQT